MSPRNPVSKPLFGPADPALLLPAVRRFILDQNLFEPGNRVLVAVSGGPDSVALLHLLLRIGPEWGLRLGVAHFDHGLRGEVSLEEARFVAGLARDLELPLHGGDGDVRGLAESEKISLQMAARRLRLGFLEKVRREHAYDRVALGHTADDQVELFFLRLLRGAGSEGLKGMWPATPQGLVRPLLSVGKDVLLSWLHQEQLPYREDQSNLSRRYLRNRVRLDLLPHLQRDYNPRLKAAVWRLMTHLQEDERLLAETTDAALKAVGRWLTRDWTALAIPRPAGPGPGLADASFAPRPGPLSRPPGDHLHRGKESESPGPGGKSGRYGDLRHLSGGPGRPGTAFLPAPAISTRAPGHAASRFRDRGDSRRLASYCPQPL